MTSQDLEWDNEGVLVEVGVYSCVEDMDCTVVRGRCEEW